jgi:hypothetical protein
MLNGWGLEPSYSRPRVSDDNPDAEALFRTATYRPEFPARGFTRLDEARPWAAPCVHGDNVEPRHSGIGYVTAAQCPAGDDPALLGARHELYSPARELNPRRWSRNTRTWTPVGAVALNPERESVVKAAGSLGEGYSRECCMIQATTSLTRAGGERTSAMKSSAGSFS